MIPHTRINVKIMLSKGRYTLNSARYILHDSPFTENFRKNPQLIATESTSAVVRDNLRNRTAKIK